MDNKRNNQKDPLVPLSVLPNPAFIPFSRYYQSNKTCSFQNFVDEYDSFKRDFMQAFYFQDGPKLRYLIDSLKITAGQLHLTDLREKCVELDLRLEQSYTIERPLVRHFLEDFNTAMLFCKRSRNSDVTPIN